MKSIYSNQFRVKEEYFSFRRDGSFSNENKFVNERSFDCHPFTPITPFWLTLISGSERPCCINDFVWFRGILKNTIGSIGSLSRFGSQNF